MIPKALSAYDPDKDVTVKGYILKVVLLFVTVFVNERCSEFTFATRPEVLNFYLLGKVNSEQ